jgi:hypothetical protein
MAADFPRVLLEWRRYVPAEELRLDAGALPDAGAVRVGAWLASEDAADDAADAVVRALAAHHAEHPLRGGMEIDEVRGALAGHHVAFADPALADAFVVHLAASGR